MVKASTAPRRRGISVPVDEAEQEATPGHETVVVIDAEPSRSSRWRLVLLAGLVVGSLAAAKYLGLVERLDVQAVRELMQSAGALGFAVFVVLFVVGALMHVPSVVFIGAAAIAYGQLLGSAAAYTGAIASVAVSFFVVRGIGGQPLGELKWKWAQRVFARLERHPVRTIALLRLVMWVSPPLNYGLAMSGIRFRDYLAGSALGLALPVPGIVLFFDWLTSLDWFVRWMM